MYEGILVNITFAGFFLAKVCMLTHFHIYIPLLILSTKQWLGRQSFLDDLELLNPDLYNGLIFLKHYTGNL
ncbi:hypothetical protein L208DRAFT_1488702, partial [Tricholoma matsutake]